MAIIHKFDGGLVLCASSSVFIASNSDDRLSVNASFNARGISESILSDKNSVHSDMEQPNTPKAVDADVQILCSTVSNCGSLLAIGTSEKVVIILETHTLKMQRSFRIPKAPTCITFDKDDSHVVVGDRAGHVHRYTVQTSNKNGYTDMNVELVFSELREKCSFEGQPLSGAVTMILDIAISHDGNFLLASDRDEKIRVSRYPQAYVIQSYCLGHTAYVRSMTLLGNRLFSSGGDSVVIEWDMEFGKQISRSEKLDERPVRRIIALEEDGTLFILAVAGSTLHVLDERLQSISSVSISQTIMDIAVVDDSIIGVSSAGVTKFSLSEGTSNEIEIPNELRQALLMSKDPISNYFKNVVHQNTLDYHKRKAEKLRSAKKNRKRKRKAMSLLKDVEDVKRIS